MFSADLLDRWLEREREGRRKGGREGWRDGGTEGRRDGESAAVVWTLTIKAEETVGWGPSIFLRKILQEGEQMDCG